MKVEVAESLVYSWLRHEKNCTIVQMNWKPSICWKKMNESWLKDLYEQWTGDEELKEYFKINKSNKSIPYDQFIAQTEIDV